MKQRNLRARIWIAVTLLLVTGAHYFFYKFSIDPLNNYRVAEGLTFGCVLWTTVLFGAMLLRYSWSRYVMITMICLAIAAFSVLALIIRSESIDPLPRLMKLVACGAGLYCLALVPLSASSSLRHFLGPKTAGER
jgi:hypothetical protein